MQIAQTILEQLGGNKFVIMTGAKQFVAIPNGIRFKLPANFADKGINFVVITLDSMDTYTMIFAKVRGMNIKPIEESYGIYCDMLQSEFKRVTGLDTHL